MNFRNLFSRTKRENRNDRNFSFDQARLISSANLKTSHPKIPSDPISIRFPTDEGNYFFWNSALGTDHSFRIKFYRFLKDNIPVLNSAIWTWTHLCSAPSTVQIKGSDDPETVKSAEKIISDLDRRIYEQSYQKFGGVDALLASFSILSSPMELSAENWF